MNDSGPVASRPQGLHWSWLVQILPFLDQPALSRGIDVAAGVYDPANRTARTTSLGVLICPDSTTGRHDSSTGLALTSYAGCHHDLEAPIGATDHGVLFLNSRVRLQDVTDGLAQTIFVGEVAGPTRWAGSPVLGPRFETRPTGSITLTYGAGGCTVARPDNR